VEFILGEEGSDSCFHSINFFKNVLYVLKDTDNKCCWEGENTERRKRIRKRKVVNKKKKKKKKKTQKKKKKKKTKKKNKETQTKKE
jgi:hypothetical protein